MEEIQNTGGSTMAKLHFLKSVTDTINTSIIFETESSVIVFDGGHKSEME